MFLKASTKGAKLKQVPPIDSEKQVKLLKDKDRKDTTGAPQSKGYGFVEFTVHDHALTALRKVNNNPKFFGPNNRPIVEFAIENARKLQARNENMNKQLDYRQRVQSGEQKGQKRRAEEEPEEENPKKKSKNGKVKKEKTKQKGDQNNSPQKAGNQRQPKQNQQQPQKNQPKQNQLQTDQSQTKAKRKPERAVKPKKKFKVDKEEEKYESLVADYKKKLMSLPKPDSNWFE